MLCELFHMGPLVTASVPTEFSYRDKKLGDTDAVTVATAPDVFHPTSTTVLLLRASPRVCASDLSAAAVRLARHNAQRNGVTLDCRRGSLFEPWAGERFDLIVDDVAGVAESIARASGWYPPAVPSDAGPDGTRWILEVLERAPDFLAPRGQLVFPVLTLSREATVLERARARFATVEQVEEQWYPL